MNSVWQDLRFGWRMLARSPWFTIVAILTLALAIGANTAIFSLTDQVFLRLLPVQHPEQLVALSSTEGRNGSVTSDYDMNASFSYPMYKELRDRNAVFSALLACFTVEANVSWRGHADHGIGELVSGNFFQVLGVRPALGRVLSAQDETAPGADPVAVLSYGYWKQHFGGDPAVLNESIEVNGTPFTVVGVAEAAFAGVEVASSRRSMCLSP